MNDDGAAPDLGSWEAFEEMAAGLVSWGDALATVVFVHPGLEFIQSQVLPFCRGLRFGLVAPVGRGGKIRFVSEVFRCG